MVSLKVLFWKSQKWHSRVVRLFAVIVLEMQKSSFEINFVESNCMCRSDVCMKIHLHTMDPAWAYLQQLQWLYGHTADSSYCVACSCCPPDTMSQWNVSCAQQRHVKTWLRCNDKWRHHASCLHWPRIRSKRLYFWQWHLSNDFG